VAFTVNCLRPGTVPPLGGLWTAWQALARAGQLAGYFNPVGTATGASEPVRLAVVADQVWPVAYSEGRTRLPGAVRPEPRAALQLGQ
jgi:hypothetical protein